MASTTGPSEITSEPTYRSFISVELPFCIPRCTSLGAIAESQGEVEKFISPSFLGSCLDCTLQTSKPPHVSKSNSKKHNNQKVELAASQRNTTLPQADTECLGGECAEEVDNYKDESEQSINLKIGDPNEYKSEPIFSGWLSTNWGNDTDTPGLGHAADIKSGHSDTPYARFRRLDVFPSLEPQLLLHGYYRNDLLVRLTRQKRVRRYRNTTTGEIAREEELPWLDSRDGDAEDGGEMTPQDREKRRVRAEVVGVVSREVTLPRPADFTFSLFTPEQQKQEPMQCSGDIFPPSRYLGVKGRVEVPYLMGRYVNRTVMPTSSETQQHGAGVVDESILEDASRSLAMALNVVVQPDDPNLPPEQSAAQRQYLAEIACSPTGLSAEDPAEVRVVASLLQHRPAWMIKDLMATVLETGRCPRVYFNKQVILALTYSITTGPFNRLRVRLGYNPYASASSVIYQRFALRFLRRSEIGMQLRDLSRSLHIEQVIKQLLDTHHDSIAEYKKQEPEVVKSTLVEQMCRIVASGVLWAPFQLIDVMDDTAIREVALHCGSRENMPLEMRPSRHGWLSESSFLHITNLFTDKLNLFMKDEVIPLLRTLSGGHVQLPPDDEENESGEDENENEDDDSSSGQKSFTGSSVNSSFSRSSLSGTDEDDDKDE
ncbi:unnamed protein product [Phytomonas sp. EM1]|nr:unnamed protein product [Phytomonas sp. EM1]|eukprot:CCW62965.1 unnamed protein product [Phytomonas sp. isolate EM1]